MSRLPNPGQDDNAWGTILNDFLSQSHNPDGTLANNVVGASQLQNASVTVTKLVDGTITASKLAGNIPSTKLDSATQTQLSSLGTASTHAATDFDAAGAAAAAQAAAVTTAANASNLTSGTVANARLPVTAQAGTLSSTYAPLESPSFTGTVTVDGAPLGGGTLSKMSAGLNGSPLSVPGGRMDTLITGWTQDAVTGNDISVSTDANKFNLTAGNYVANIYAQLSGVSDSPGILVELTGVDGNYADAGTNFVIPRIPATGSWQGRGSCWFAVAVDGPIEIHLINYGTTADSLTYAGIDIIRVVSGPKGDKGDPGSGVLPAWITETGGGNTHSMTVRSNGQIYLTDDDAVSNSGNGVSWQAGTSDAAVDQGMKVYTGNFGAHVLAFMGDGILKVDGVPVGAPAGVNITRAFPFAFDTPGILTGAALYTPTVGEILMDAWIGVDTAWDGTTPKGDLGTFTGGDSGWYGAYAQDFYHMEIVDHASWNMHTGMNGYLPTLRDLMLTISGTLNLGSGLFQVSGSNINAQTPISNYSSRILPMKFAAADPIKVCVSQDGTNTGADPGSTQGSGVLYLVTCTPA